ncbi:hypothetical protein [Parageobacillus thermoglucosidasius]|uniref:Uncharacterized protein n=1 Tax=Parageobacillus thermoglucosidasius TaxID=1426 RepID=A0AB38QZG8_PARTM|nr:hypothetical protein [Parageobacillus thermoglucosidasius]UOE75849.1 hypothetical protein IMI45_16385 [Parageobacillus thermoglucosidasius]
MSKIGRRGEVWYDEIKGKSRFVVVVSNDNVVVEIDHFVPTVTSKQTRNQYYFCIGVLERSQN